MMQRPVFNCDVLVAGEYYCDLIFSGLPDVPRLGADMFAAGLDVMPGGTYNMVLALKRLGLSAPWACDFGTDLFSRLVLEQAERDGINPMLFNRLDRPVQRVSSAFSKAGERGFISYSETAIVAPDPAVLEKAQPKWLLQTFRFDADWLDFIAAARGRGARVFGDCRYGDFTLAKRDIAEFLGLMDVFSPNEAEALALTGAGDIEEALSQLATLTPAVVIKRGALGASVLARGERFDVPAPAVTVRDTVGAGDAFNAGFLYGAVARRSLQDCVRLAVICGAISTTGPGSSAVPTAASLADYLAGDPVPMFNKEET
jgi:sugar/nucleoside kinase (ribokinase family)